MLSLQCQFFFCTVGFILVHSISCIHALIMYGTIRICIHLMVHFEFRAISSSAGEVKAYDIFFNQFLFWFLVFAIRRCLFRGYKRMARVGFEPKPSITITGVAG